MALGGKHFEARAVSRSEFEALKRFGDYEELPNSILMRIEGDKEFRIYCDDVEKWSFGLITPGFCSMLEEADRSVGIGSALYCHRRAARAA